MTLIEGQGWKLWNEILPRWENFAEMLKTAATGFSHAAAAGNLFLGIFPDFFCIYVWFFWIPPGEKTLQNRWKRLQLGSLMQLLLGKPLRNAAPSSKCYFPGQYVSHPINPHFVGFFLIFMRDSFLFFWISHAAARNYCAMRLLL